MFTALIAWFVFRENFDRRIALGMALIVGGGRARFARARLAGRRSAVARCLSPRACLAWAIDNNLTRKVSAGDPVTIAAIKGAGRRAR